MYLQPSSEDENDGSIFVGIMSPVPRKDDEENDAFRMEIDMDTFRAEYFAAQRRHTQIIAVCLSITVMMTLMILYLIPVDRTLGPSITQVVIFSVNMIIILLLIVWLFWRLCCRSVGTVPYVQFKNIENTSEEKLQKAVKETLLL